MGKLGDYLEGTTRTGLGCMLLASVGAFLFVSKAIPGLSPNPEPLTLS
jgi:hypothetical protein